MKILNFKFMAVLLIVLSAIQVSFVSCSDDPGLENYYTTTKEYASDYLINRKSQYSDFLTILGRATGERGDLRLIDMLGTYGSYTVFAPTNDAVHDYLLSRGMTSLDELSKEDCDTIALNSIIETAYFTTDYSNTQYPKANMLEHVMSISCDTLLDENGEVKLQLLINKESVLTHADDSVCNGVVHTVGRIVNTSNDLLPTLMEQDSLISIYNAALAATKVRDLMEVYVDETYGFISNQARIDSCTWSNDKLCIHTAVEYDNVAYPEKRYFNFTMFAVKDEVLAEKYGITDLEGLRAKAKELYQPVFPEDEGVTDETDRRNYLNRFISYHILNRFGTYYKLTGVDNGKLTNNYNRRKWDMADWYETLMPHSILKCSFPSGSQVGLYINRRGVQSHADDRGVFVRGAKVATAADGPKSPTARNGIYHYIDDIIAYDENTQKVVLNERFRFDATTLSPDFMTLLTDGEIARGHTSRNSANNYMYGAGSQGTNAASNKDLGVGFKAGYVRNMEFTDNTHIHVRGRVLGYWSYQGDELTVKGPFDLNVKLPPVPEGTYEVRLMTCVGFGSRGIVQAYIDGKAQGIPFDMRPGSVFLFGWKNDASLGDDDEITAFDKAIHNVGWMKGPGAYSPGEKDAFGGNTMRDLDNTIRRVLGTFYTDGKSDHYLRLQQKMESGGELNFDFLEICPSSVYNSEYYAEDKW